MAAAKFAGLRKSFVAPDIQRRLVIVFRRSGDELPLADTRAFSTTTPARLRGLSVLALDSAESTKSR
jgi:hypothetical protein